MKHILITTIAALVLVGCARQELLQWKFDKEFYAAVQNNDREAVKKPLLLGNCFSSSDFLELHGPGKVGVQLLTFGESEAREGHRSERTSLLAFA